MKIFFPKTPKFVTWLYPKRIWAFSRLQNRVYLTFDDGPIPEVTPWVLQQLQLFNAKATFFCIAENIQKHTEIFQNILTEGHAFGNHTFNHLKGPKTPAQKYLNNVMAFEEVIQPSNHPTIQQSKLFRPPYGKLTQKQAKGVQSKGYKIIMWDVLSYDWDKTISEETCLQHVLKNIRPGSIVVFHDSLKAEKNMKYTLPRVLEFIQKKGWKAEKIEMSF
ncbi:MAG: polysaccharide deacetylase family protein [Flavobacteriaceae bacterium]|nr:polysaccharide deacetylase family protein [Flavobacteriaceae bacterium]